MTFRRKFLWALFLLSASFGLVYFSHYSSGWRQVANIAVLTVTVINPNVLEEPEPEPEPAPVELPARGASGSRATAAVFSGHTLPNALVYVLKDGQWLATFSADAAGLFASRLTRLNPGFQIFSLWAADASRRTKLVSVPVLLRARADTPVAGINLLDLFTTAARRGDLNDDGPVNLIDFSIAAYWHDKSLPAILLAREKERLNGDGRIDMADFSIMAYYWTG